MSKEDKIEDTSIEIKEDSKDKKGQDIVKEGKVEDKKTKKDHKKVEDQTVKILIRRNEAICFLDGRRIPDSLYHIELTAKSDGEGSFIVYDGDRSLGRIYKNKVVEL